MDNLTWGQANQLADEIVKSGLTISKEETETIYQVRSGYSIRSKGVYIPVSLTYAIKGVHDKIKL